jgi:hypothetical protein
MVDSIKGLLIELSDAVGAQLCVWRRTKLGSSWFKEVRFEWRSDAKISFTKMYGERRCRKKNIKTCFWVHKDLYELCVWKKEPDVLQQTLVMGDRTLLARIEVSSLVSRKFYRFASSPVETQLAKQYSSSYQGWITRGTSRNDEWCIRKTENEKESRSSGERSKWWWRNSGWAPLACRMEFRAKKALNLKQQCSRFSFPFRYVLSIKIAVDQAEIRHCHCNHGCIILLFLSFYQDTPIWPPEHRESHTFTPDPRAIIANVMIAYSKGIRPFDNWPDGCVKIHSPSLNWHLRDEKWGHTRKYAPSTITSYPFMIIFLCHF